MPRVLLASDILSAPQGIRRNGKRQIACARTLIPAIHFMAPEVHMYSVVLWEAGSDRRFSLVICTSPPTLTLPDSFIDRHGIV